MIGRQVIPINKPITLQELEQIMQEHWDKEQYGKFKIGKPTSASLEEYILLPATPRFLIIVYPRKAGGLCAWRRQSLPRDGVLQGCQHRRYPDDRLPWHKRGPRHLRYVCHGRRHTKNGISIKQLLFLAVTTSPFS